MLSRRPHTLRKEGLARKKKLRRPKCTITAVARELSQLLRCHREYPLLAGGENSQPTSGERASKQAARKQIQRQLDEVQITDYM